MANRLATGGFVGNPSQLLTGGYGVGGKQATVQGNVGAGGSFSATKGYVATVVDALQISDSYTGDFVGPGYFKDGASLGGSFTWLKPGEIYVPPFVVANIARAVLTGAPDGQPDLPLIIRSFSGSIRGSGEDQLTIVCPYVEGLPEQIDLRPNGDLLLYIGTRNNEGAENLSQLMDVNLSTVRPDYGPRSWSITLSGYKGVTYDTPSSHTLPNSSYYSETNGKSRVRVNGPIDTNIKPGDSVTAPIAQRTFTVASISYSASRGRSQTELLEA